MPQDLPKTAPRPSQEPPRASKTPPRPLQDLPKPPSTAPQDPQQAFFCSSCIRFQVQGSAAVGEACKSAAHSCERRVESHCLCSCLPSAGRSRNSARRARDFVPLGGPGRALQGQAKAGGPVVRLLLGALGAVLGAVLACLCLSWQFFWSSWCSS